MSSSETVSEMWKRRRRWGRWLPPLLAALVGVGLDVDDDEAARLAACEADESQTVPESAALNEDSPGEDCVGAAKFAGGLQNALMAAVLGCIIGDMGESVNVATSSVAAVMLAARMGRSAWREGTNRRSLQIHDSEDAQNQSIWDKLEWFAPRAVAGVKAFTEFVFPAGPNKHVRMHVNGPTQQGYVALGTHLDAHMWDWLNCQMRLVFATATATIVFTVMAVDGNFDPMSSKVYASFKLTVPAGTAYLLGPLLAGHVAIGYTIIGGKRCALRVFHTVLGIRDWRYALILSWSVSPDEVDGEVERLRALAAELVDLDDANPDVLAALEDEESENARKDVRAEYVRLLLLERRKREALYRATHRDEIRARGALYRATHREELRARGALYRATHSEELRARDRARGAVKYATNREAILARVKRYNATPAGRLTCMRSDLRAKYGTDDAAAYSISDRCRLAAALRAKAAADGDSTLGTVAQISRLETAIFVPILVYIDFAGRVHLSRPPRPYPIRFDPTADSDFLCFACGTAIAPRQLTQARTQHFSCPRCHRAAVPPPPNQCHICGKSYLDKFALKSHLYSYHTRSERARHDN